MNVCRYSNVIVEYGEYFEKDDFFYYVKKFCVMYFCNSVLG